jgi:hypothetical protein
VWQLQTEVKKDLTFRKVEKKVSSGDKVISFVQCTRYLPGGRQAKYKVPNWKYIGNRIEIDSASLREINRKYDGNMIEIDSAATA